MKKIQILGFGGERDIILAKNAEQAVKELGLKMEIEKILDTDEIIRYGALMLTPALAIDGNVKIKRRVAPVEEIKKILTYIMEEEIKYNISE